MRSTSSGFTGRRKARVAKRLTISRAASRGSRPSAMGQQLFAGVRAAGGGGGLYGPSATMLRTNEQPALRRFVGRIGRDIRIDEADAERAGAGVDADLGFERLQRVAVGRGHLETSLHLVGDSEWRPSPAHRRPAGAYTSTRML